MTDMTTEQALRKLLATAEENPFCPVGHLVEHGLGGADALRAALSRPPATELAPESWREELETIAEILEADGDEWNCAARIRKMLKTSPAEAQVPEGYARHLLTASPAPEQNPAKDFCDAHCTFLGHHPACAIGRQQEEAER